MTIFQSKKLVLHYKWIDRKKSVTFLFINSLGTDFRIWDRVLLPLETYGNILLYDKRGHGLSDAGHDTKGLDEFAEDAESLLNHLKIERCIVIGLSVGGMIAQILATKNPQKIEKLILCDTSYKIGNDQIWNDRISVVNEKGLASISEGVMQRWFSESFRKVEQEVRIYRNMLERCSPSGYVKTCEAIRDADLATTAKGIKIKTMCIVGSEDKSTTPDEVKALADLIEGARFNVIDGSAHLPCVDNPEKLSRLIIDFIHE